MRSGAIFVGLLAACGDSGVTHYDAAIDTPTDSDAGMCGADQLFVGEYVDWLSDVGGTFCGVNGAVWTVHGDSTLTKTSAPNGRVELCIPTAATTQFDITPPPSTTGQCSVPTPDYMLPGLAIVTNAAVTTGDLFSSRAISMAEIPTFFTAQGLPAFDGTKAQLFIHEDGTSPGAVAITATHATTQAFDGSTWAAGSAGVNVYFPNVDLGAGTTDVTVTGGAIGTTAIPLVAGTFTYLTVVAN